MTSIETWTVSRPFSFRQLKKEKSKRNTMWPCEESLPKTQSIILWLTFTIASSAKRHLINWMINFQIEVKRVKSCLIICHIINTMSLVMPTALILNIKKEVIIPAILHTWLYFVCVCGGQGEGHPSAWVNVSMPPSLANRSCCQLLPNCTNERRPRSRTACQGDWSGWFASLHVHASCYMQMDASMHRWVHDGDTG